MSSVLSGTPRADGFHMPAEFEPQSQVWLVWPERPDSWRDHGKPAQVAYTAVATAISRFTPVTMIASPQQFEAARAALPPNIRVVEMTNDEAWLRDSGPTFVVNAVGDVRAVDWDFNAWGGAVDGLYTPWDNDQLLPRKICEIERIDEYRTPGFVLEGGSIHVDGQGTLCTTEMCLLSAGRNPQMSKADIEHKLGEMLGIDTVIWLTEGMDPAETNGHVDDCMTFVRPGEVACIYSDDPSEPFHDVAQRCYEELCDAVDAHGRRLKVHKVCLPHVGCTLKEEFDIDITDTAFPRVPGTQCTASYVNFLITNGGVIVPQYDDPHDGLALKQIAALFPDRAVVGVPTREIVYGGGNIHCITQQQPAGHRPV